MLSTKFNVNLARKLTEANWRDPGYGGEVVSLMRWPPFTPGMISGTNFCLSLSRPQGP
jgi:hypothetical protein